MGSTTQIDPRSVANIMISFAARRDIPLTHVAIQKLVYFAHASYLVRHDIPLVSGYFEAWEHGPVHRVLYNALRANGRQIVRGEITRRDPFSGQEETIPPPTEYQILDHVEEIMRRLGSLPPGRLIDLSHAPGGPWDYIWNKAKTEPVLGNRISDTVTKRLFPQTKIGVPLEPRFGDVDEAAPLTDD